MDSSASKLRSFIKWIRKERSQNNSIVQKALETNLRRMYYLALVVIPMHIAYVVMFWITEPSSGKEAVWRTGIIVVHSIHLIVSLALAIIISRAKRQNHLSNKAVFIQYAFIVSLSAMAISLVTIDQHVTTNITPFLVLCLGLAVIFLLRPTSAFIIFSVVLTAYLLLIGIVQKEPHTFDQQSERYTSSYRNVPFTNSIEYNPKESLPGRRDQKTAERTRRKKRRTPATSIFRYSHRSLQQEKMV